MTEPTTTLTRQVALAKACEALGRFEGLLLVSHVLGITKEQLIAFDEEPITEAQMQSLELYIQTRLAGMPMPYIVGRQEFYGRYFEVTPDVLIPRPDTEVLIEQTDVVLPSQARVLDLGTGSGCVAITLKLQHPDIAMTAVDISPAALEVAQRNAQSLGAEIAFLQGSWYDALPSETRFDVIVSNPPYIASGDEHLLHLTFEPRGALTDEADGLICLFEIISQAPQHLVEGGWLLVEHGYDQAQAVQELFQSAGFSAIRTIKDYGGNDRVTMGRLAGSPA